MRETDAIHDLCARGIALAVLACLSMPAVGDESPFVALRKVIGHRIEITEKSSEDARTLAHWQRGYTIEGTTGCTLLLRVVKSFRSVKSGSWSGDDLYTIPFASLDQHAIWLDDEGDFEKTTWEPHLYLACAATQDHLSTISVAGTLNGEASRRQESSFCISFTERPVAAEVVQLIKDAARTCSKAK